MVFRDNRRSCPRCGGELEPGRAPSGHAYEGCAGCDGRWIDMGTLHDMFDVMKPLSGTPAMEERHDDDRALPCPVCTRPMEKVLFHELELDRCEGHGFWFDDHELWRTLLGHAEE